MKRAAAIVFAVVAASIAGIVWTSSDAPSPKMPRTTIPEKRATVAYGEYVANDVHRCWECHGEDYGGGVRLEDPERKSIFGTNITFGEQGIGGWSLPQFATALRDGVHKDRTILRLPMPRYRLVDDTEMAALYAYLQSVPKSRKENETGQAKPREKAPAADAKPEEMFAKLGCATCHAKGAPFRARFKEAATKDPAWIAQWIRNPERTTPNTQMPTFETILSEEQALALATWVKAEAAKAD